MSESSFSVTAAAPQFSLEASGAGAASFTVTNVSTRPLRCQVRLSPQGETQPGWLKITGPLEHDLGASETRQVSVAVQVPPGVAPGRYAFRLDACSTANPDDDFTSGPVVAFQVAAPPVKPPPKAFPGWILWLVLGLVVVGGGVTVWFVLPRAEKPVIKGNVVTVPDFTKGNPDLELVKQLFSLFELEILAEERFDGIGTVGKGRVVDQDPKPGQQVALGSTVKLFVQPPLVTVPNLIGLNANVAAKKLLDLKLDMTTTLRRPAPGQANEIVVDQNPKQGANRPLRTPVQLTVTGIRFVVVEGVFAEFERMRAEPPAFQSKTFKLKNP